ncbi:MAG: hypothetical protein QXT19_01260 [Candidatus Woesearchaeota archaeon]
MQKEAVLVVFTFLLTSILVPTGIADSVIINSQDWIDVYSGMLFARLTGNPSIFLTSKRYVTVLEKVLPPSDNLLIIESEHLPYSANLGGYLRRLGYDPKTVFSRGGLALNLALAKELNLTRFIIIDPTYGFNAVSVAPYAIATNAFVIFAEDKNIDQVFSFLASQQKIDKLLIYGQVSKTVLEKLSGFSPEIIDTGHRYKDNIEILNRYFQAVPDPKQAILTSGEFLESQIIGGEPIILVGKERVLENTINFVKNSNLKTAVLIGNELTRAAKMLKDSTGLPVFVKIGQGIPMGLSEYEPIKALDMFYLPALVIRIDLAYVQYNTLEKTLEVVYRNSGSRATLFGTISVMVDGTPIQTVGDKDLQRLERNETRGFRYSIDLSEYVAQKRNLTADVFTVYGESPEIMDRAIAAQVPIRVSTANDQCELKLGRVAFDKRTQRISVRLDNPSNSDCYASINLIDLIIDDEPQLISYPGQAFVRAHSGETFRIKQRMTPVDIADNPTVHVRVLYGAREGLLFSVIDEIVPFRMAGEYTTIMIVGMIAVLLILVIVLFVLWRRSKKDRHYSGDLDYRKWRGKMT